MTCMFISCPLFLEERIAEVMSGTSCFMSFCYWFYYLALEFIFINLSVFVAWHIGGGRWFFWMWVWILNSGYQLDSKHLHTLSYLTDSYLAFLNFIKDRISLSLCYSSLLLSCLSFAWREGSMLGLSLPSLKLVTLCVHYYILVLWGLDQKLPFNKEMIVT